MCYGCVYQKRVSVSIFVEVMVVDCARICNKTLILATCKSSIFNKCNCLNNASVCELYLPDVSILTVFLYC